MRLFVFVCLFVLILSLFFVDSVDAKAKKRGKRKVKGKDKGGAKKKGWQPPGSNLNCERDWDCPKGSGEICIWKKCIEPPKPMYHDEL